MCIFAYIYHTHQPNVGRYRYHTWIFYALWDIDELISIFVCLLESVAWPFLNSQNVERWFGVTAANAQRWQLRGQRNDGGFSGLSKGQATKPQPTMSMLSLKHVQYMLHIWGFPKIMVPQNGWFIMENSIFNGWFGSTSILGNTHIHIYTPHGPALIFTVSEARRWSCNLNATWSEINMICRWDQMDAYCLPKYLNPESQLRMQYGRSTEVKRPSPREALQKHTSHVRYRKSLCRKAFPKQLVGGWTNPSEKYARQIGSCPQF